MRKETYYSQFGEDRVLSEIFRGKRDGVCVEVGANDGVADSTTLHFENLGWQCVLVEPNPELCGLIREKRKAMLHECAASNLTGMTTLYVAEGAERAHGVSTICESHEARGRIESYGFTVRPIRVRTQRLDDILESSALRGNIDFISIDVEGHELEALQGMSLKRWSPKIILVEDNSNFQNAAVRKWLEREGYSSFKRTGVNDWFAPVSNRSLVNCRSKGRYVFKALRSRFRARFQRPFLLKSDK